MRYYAIRIHDKNGNLIVPDPTTRKFVANPRASATYTSHNGPQLIPGALNVELDIPSSTFANPQGGAHVRIWGVSLVELSQSSDLAYYSIEVLAGMKGAPALNQNAKPGQIVQGMIFQAYGNWHGVDQHLDLIIYPGPQIPIVNANIVLNWQKGQTLADALETALSSAFPNYELQVNISKITQDHTEAGHYRSVAALSAQVYELTKGYFDDSYPGVNITMAGNTIYVYDTATGANTRGNPIPIAFEDLIGQPTWIGPFTLTFQCPMRADIMIGDWIKLPTGIYPPFVQTAAGTAYPNAGPSMKSAFEGAFQVTEAHHYGNYREPDAASWNTTYTAIFPVKNKELISGHDLVPPNLV